MPEIQEKCNIRAMRAYSLYADSPGLSSKNSICPSLTDNCCGPMDQENIRRLWYQTLKRITKYQILFLYMVKYILTQFQDWQRLSMNIMKAYKHFSKEVSIHEQSGKDFVWSYKNMKILINSDLAKFAELIASNPLSAVQLELMYKDFNQAAEFMINMRRHFYCIICSASGQESLQRKGNLLRHLWTDVQIDEEVCNVLAYQHLMYFHSYLKFFKRLQRFIEFLPYFLVIDNGVRILETQPEPPNLVFEKLSSDNKSTNNILHRILNSKEEQENRAQEFMQYNKPPNPNGFEISTINSAEQGERQQNSNTQTNRNPGGVVGPGVRNKEDKSFMGGTIELDANYEFQYKKVDFQNLPHYHRSFNDKYQIEKVDQCLQNPNLLNCILYCEDFNIAKGTDTFDGDIAGVKHTFDILRNYKYKVNFLKENDFDIDFVKIERYIDEFYYTTIFKERFIISTDPSSLDVATLGTSFSTVSAVNPFTLGKGNSLIFSFKYAKVISSILVSVMIALLI